MSEQTYIVGYHNSIYQAVWRRPMVMGVPRMLGHLWMALCLYAGLISIFLLGVWWLLLPLAVWGIGQGVLMVLMRMDPQFDDIFLAQLGRKYQLRYDIG